MNILITSDIHINDFRNYNLFNDPKFRLNQFATLSLRLADIIRVHDVSAVIIAGDLFHVAAPRAQILNRGIDFLKTLAALAPVYVTGGQHDFDARFEMHRENTILSACTLVENTFYLHKEAVNIGSRSFYFQGWMPEYDLSHINHGEYDILIGHATVPNSVINQSQYVLSTGQDVDSNKFKLAFLGDIHYHQVKGNIIIPGTPIQNNFNDHPDVGVIILDDVSLEWRRVPTITSDVKFLRFISKDHYLGNYELDEYTILSDKKEEASASVQKLHKSLSVIDVIEASVTSELRPLHAKLMASIPLEITSEVDLNFTLRNITIDSFKSIDHFEMEVKPGIYQISGKNGTGKSSLLEAISYVFGCTAARDTVSKDLKNVNKGDICVSIDLNYSRLDYTITRSQSRVSISSTDAENQNALKDKILNSLKFIPYTDLFYFGQDRIGLLSSYNYAARVDLISRILGLKIINALYDASKSELNAQKAEEQDLRNALVHNEKIVAETDTIDFSSLDIDYKDLISKCNEALVKVNEAISSRYNYDKLTIEFAASSEYVMSFSENFASIDINYDSLQETLKSTKSSLVAVIDNCYAELRDMQAKYTECEREEIQNEKKLASLADKLKTVKNSKCYVCGSALSNIHTLLADLQLESDTINKRILECRSIRIATTPIIDEKKAELVNLKQKLDKIQIKLSEIESKKSEQAKLVERRLMHQRALDKISTLKISMAEAHTKYEELCKDISGDLEESKLHLVSEIARLNADNTRSAELESLKSYRDSAISKISSIELDLIDSRSKLSNIDKYVTLMSPIGVVTRSVMEKVSELLTSDNIRVKTFRTQQNGEIKPDFTAEMQVGKSWISYDQLSWGQKTLVDMTILDKLLELSGGVGVLILDETLKYLDYDVLDTVTEIIKGFNAKTVFICSHVDNFPYSDYKISTSIVDGFSRYVVT